MSSRPIRGAARLAAILDALPDALLLVNSNGTVVDANNAAVQSLQAPGTSLVGMGVLDLLPDFDPSRIPGSMRPAPREDDALDRPVRMTARRTDGTAFPVEVSGNDFADDGASEGRGYALSPLVPYDPYRDSPRQSSGSDLLLLLVRDLSSRLGVEAELRRQHKQTEMILRAAAEGVLGVDLEGRCVLVNPAAAHILEYRASELGGRELHPLIQHSKADGSPLTLEESALLDTLTSGRKHRVRGAVLWRKDGRPVTVDLTTAPVRDGDQLVGAVMTFTDRSRELALVARNEHLTAVLESELGGALTALHRRIDALAGDPAGQLWPEANWTLRRLADECRRFGKLIDGVLSYQRYEAGAESGQSTPEREPVSMDKVVRRAVEHAGELVGAGRVRFSVHAAAVEVIADEERLAQALAHLVADVSGVALSLDAVATVDGVAAPASPGPAALPPSGGDAPMVVLAAAQRGEVARVEIRGPGLGPSPVHLPIARSVVERHGGVLQSHELPNRAGTTYVVELPLDPATAKAAAERAAAGGRRDAPKESDTAVLPDLPGIPQLPSGERTTETDGTDDTGAEAAEKSAATRPAPAQAQAPSAAPEDEGRTGRGRRAARTADPEHWQDAPAARNGQGGGTGTGVTLGRTVPEQWNGDNGDAGYGRAAADQADRPEHDLWRGGDNGGTAYAVPAGDADRAADDRDSAPEPRAAAPAAKTSGGPIALGPGPSAAPAEPEHPPAQQAPEPGPLALGPAATAPEPAADQAPAQAQGPSRRRRALPAAAEEPPAGFSLPGVPDPGTPLYPGLEHALPAGPAPAAPEPGTVPPTGRRRRLAVPPGGEAEARPEEQGEEQGPTPATPEAAPAASGALEIARPALPAGGNLPATTQAAQPGGAEAAEPRPPQPVGSGLGELAPPRPMGAGGQLPGAFPAAPAGTVAVPQPSGPGDGGAPVEARTPPRPMAELAPAGHGEPAPAPAGDPSAADAPAGDANARRLLVWPEPDPSTKQALQERGYHPVIVRSREEVDAQVTAFPAALFVDPLTGPITRTALQSLRTAALNSRVPVLVTAGLGQSTREAAYGADPAVLLRALAPRDGENHAPRVLLVESDPDIAAAMISSLERRGMHVEHAVDENDAVSRASSVQPNLVVMDLLQIRRRRVGLLDWLRANDRLHRTPLVVYTSVDLDPRELPRLRTGETVLFLAERSTSPDVQSRIVDLLGRIGSLGEPGAATGAGMMRLADR
ncbi:PAS domain-containing protein [Kitasatospora sp. NBC_00240]|uniref:response regulator n=1 Tax=Kitasatospora sp. NBC_00240 TaxID=2903567 RepID=UPI0022511CC8|nr:PAS domain-containing protein [Kitasatospora sp. NBC_00240]MCX5211909.1 PAS domain-containing protein [Kitasatospora sp. NBC_00240]